MSASILIFAIPISDNEKMATVSTRIDAAAQRSRRALAEMAMAQLDAMERADFAVLERPRSVTPLRKLWIAWKHRRP